MPNEDERSLPGRSLKVTTPLQPLSTFVQAMERRNSPSGRSPVRVRSAANSQNTTERNSSTMGMSNLTGSGSRGGTPRKAATIANARLAALSGSKNSLPANAAATGPARLRSVVPLPSDLSSSDYIGDTPTSRFHHQQRQQADRVAPTIQDTIIARRPTNRLPLATTTTTAAATTLKARRVARPNSNVFLRRAQEVPPSMVDSWPSLTGQGVKALLVQFATLGRKSVVALLLLPSLLVQRCWRNKSLLWMAAGLLGFILILYAMVQLDWKVSQRIGQSTISGSSRSLPSNSKPSERIGKMERQERTNNGENAMVGLKHLEDRIAILEQVMSGTEVRVQGMGELLRKNQEDIQSKLMNVDEKDLRLELKLSNLETSFNQLVETLNSLRQSSNMEGVLSELRRDLSSLKERLSVLQASDEVQFRKELTTSIEQKIPIHRRDGKVFIDTDVATAIRQLMDNNTWSQAPTTKVLDKPTPNHEEVANLVAEQVQREVADWRKLNAAEYNEMRSLLTSLEERIPSVEFIQHEVDRVKGELESKDKKDEKLEGEPSMADYALETMGTRAIPPFTSPPYQQLGKSWVNRLMVSLLGLGMGKPPRVALSPENGLGNCWAFNGPQGNLTLALGQPIIPTHISIDHIPASLNIDRSSAPRRFQVFALQKLTHHPDGADCLLGEFEYQLTGPAVQTFELPLLLGRPISLIRLAILSNHGKRDYTCLYRFRIHSHALGGSNIIDNNDPSAKLITPLCNDSQ